MKHHMVVRNRQQLRGALREPELTRGTLALGAVSQPAGVIGDGLIPAAIAPVEVAAQHGGAAGRNPAQHPQVLECQPPAMPLDEGITISPDDVGHLQGWPVHLFELSWVRVSASSGLVVSCTCCWETCR